jgi:hypothetical protein
MKKFIFKIYVKYIRPRTSSVLDKIFSTEIIPNAVWYVYRDYSLYEFEKLVSNYKYKKDPVGGLIDFNYEDPNMFFDQRTKYRDCDDTSHVWKLWFEHNGYTAQEVIVTTKKRVARDAHVICIAEKDGTFWCANYHIFGEYKTFEEAVEAVCKWKKYSKDTLLWLPYNALGRT